MPALIYAIGDVHGCLEQLVELEARIAADRKARGVAGLIVMLGDYVDRGPQSSEVIAHLMGPPPNGFDRICLAGNHEDAMVRFAADPGGGTDWLEFGGRQTLQSYGIELEKYEGPTELGRAGSGLPQDHLAFLGSLPVACTFQNLIFAHAGLRPRVAVDDHSDHELMWMRHAWRPSQADAGRLVVQGHIAGAVPRLSPNRIILDTGCYRSGTLTAGCFADGAFVGILTS